MNGMVKSQFVDKGIYTLLIHETDVITTEGSVQSIQEPSKKFINNFRDGKDITVNGVTYFIAKQRQLQQGDYIKFSYVKQNYMIVEYELLPQSNSEKMDFVSEEHEENLMIYNFSYSDYLQCIWPTGIGLLLTTAGIVIMAMIQLLKLSQKRKADGLSEKDKIRVAIVVFVFALGSLTLLKAPSSLYSSVLLMIDQRETPQYVEGTIQAVNERIFVSADTRIVNYYIDDISYMSFDVEGVQCGTRVRIGYLPNSKAVLSMEILDN